MDTNVCVYVHTYIYAYAHYYLVELLRHGAIECHVLDNIGPLSLIWCDDSNLFRLHSTLHQSCYNLLDISSLGTTKYSTCNSNYRL